MIVKCALQYAATLMITFDGDDVNITLDLLDECGDRDARWDVSRLWRNE